MSVSMINAWQEIYNLRFYFLRGNSHVQTIRTKLLVIIFWCLSMYFLEGGSILKCESIQRNSLSCNKKFEESRVGCLFNFLKFFFIEPLLIVFPFLLFRMNFWANLGTRFLGIVTNPQSLKHKSSFGLYDVVTRYRAPFCISRVIVSIDEACFR